MLKWSTFCLMATQTVTHKSATDESRALNDNLKQVGWEPEHFFPRIVTRDQTWLYQYGPEEKPQPKQWLPRDGSGPFHKAKAWCQQQGSCNSFLECEKHFACWLSGEPKNGKSAPSECSEKVSQRCGRKKLLGKLHYGVLHHNHILAQFSH